MKQITVFSVVLFLFTVPLTDRSLTSAGDTLLRERAQQVHDSDDVARAAWVAKWEQDLAENGAAWDAWRDDFKLATESDAAYAVAVEAVQAVEFDPSFDPDQYAALVTVRNAELSRIAREVYEQHFGLWPGGDAEFGVLVQLLGDGDNLTSIRACAFQARKACGEGNVSFVRVTAGGGCSFACKNLAE